MVGTFLIIALFSDESQLKTILALLLHNVSVCDGRSPTVLIGTKRTHRLYETPPVPPPEI